MVRNGRTAQQPAKKAWLEQVPGPLKKIMRNVHGPLMANICEDMGFEDKMFMHRMQYGFPVAGMMDHSSVGMVPDDKIRPQVLSMTELYERRVELNMNAVAKMREVEHAEDLTDLANEDALTGHMTKPICGSETSLLGKDILVSRRIPVREWKGSLKKWRTRPVDHGSESGLKAATDATERTQVQGLEFLVTLLLMFMHAGLQPLMWKGI